ncbi:YdeI/OmpD-associated family protein [Microbacterium sp. BK668]|uniref:YdeI/OmpD-associated family protein n=1 Tax=Microbacterium sp. BK668 TaxID=2512118 RepID=UPI0010D6E5C7|nr:YdeI/OmpD-associated family protein [Microbacterium sp. BK668]TDN91711.1 bacteriocin resistance YdeI/OmpD-like protein [Microbacterium sp. BK668]
MAAFEVGPRAAFEVGPGFAIEAFVEPMEWGRSRYTVIRMPGALVTAAAAAGTRRVGGELEGVGVNFALTRAPVIDDTFVWAGAALLRRLRVEVGDPVSGRLAPVDPDSVPLAADLAEALEDAGRLDEWEALPPTTRRRKMVPLDAAATEATRRKRIDALIAGL